MSTVNLEALQTKVGVILGHKVSLNKSRGYATFSYGRAQVQIPSPFDGTLKGRTEGKGHPRGQCPEQYSVADAADPNKELAKIVSTILRSGRTSEVGKGIGKRDWGFRVNGSGCTVPWESLIEQVVGTSARTRTESWDLNPDYQRGAVWSQKQQERFIGHVLAGGEVPPIYAQRYDSQKTAPAGTNYINLPIEVIDGQQRIRAIMAFMAGECGAQVYHGGKWHTYWYVDTHEGERGMDLSSQIVYVDLNREDRLRFYLRLNGGVAHTDEELDKVRNMLTTEYGTGE